MSGSLSNGTLSTGNATDPADIAALLDIGLLLIPSIVGPVCETCFVTLYTVIFALTVYSVFHRGPLSRTSLVMLIVLFYLYAISVTLWALDLSALFLLLRAMFLEAGNLPAGTPLEDIMNNARAVTANFGTPEEALFLFNMIVGDSVVIWRVWVIWTGSRWVVSIPVTLLLISTAFAFLDIACLTNSGFGSQTSIAGGGEVCSNAELISWAISLGTNAASTILISIKAWQHRRLVKEINGAQTAARVSVHKTLTLLVESGFIYCLFWLTQLVLFVPITFGKPSVYFYAFLGALGDQLSGAYPTIIILIVNFQRSVWASSTGGPDEVELEFPTTTATASVRFGTSAIRSDAAASGSAAGRRRRRRWLHGNADSMFDNDDLQSGTVSASAAHTESGGGKMLGDVSGEDPELELQIIPSLDEQKMSGIEEP
uniref:Pheromone receptor n=1 Tax=Mycena chlorophos TaxID=658473 RepID=A0ABQ0LPZ0_MYCCL|nr:predicted protein [Mycena chlorophos]